MSKLKSHLLDEELGGWKGGRLLWLKLLVVVSRH